MGIYETGLRSVVRQAMRVAEHRIGGAGELGRPLAQRVDDAPPVLLVHGFGNDSSSMTAVERSLRRDGFRVYTIDLPEFGFGDAFDDARVVGRRIEEIRAQTGADQVDIVGHSRGGMVARTWQQLVDTRGTTGRVVTVSSANRGVHFGPMDRLVGAAVPEGMQQLRRGNALIDDLARTAEKHDIAVVGTTGMDGVLVPADTTRIPGKPWIPADDGRTIGSLSRVGHWEMLRDDTAFEAIRGALLLPRQSAASVSATPSLRAAGDAISSASPSMR